MQELIQINKSPVKCVLRQLLADKSTGKNIVFATDIYSGYGFSEHDQITQEALSQFSEFDIQPRVCKAKTEQELRTRKKAEVFTPAWICNKMNGYCDSDLFGREDVFNRADIHSWFADWNPVEFPEDKDWKSYIDSRRLEITCGEAPYLVSRYNAATGEPIPIQERIGILDRKLRIVGENTSTREEWLKWAERAVQSVYGYEYQGDNLLIARINVLETFLEYHREKWRQEPDIAICRHISNIIAWNLWQMDGLSDTVPFDAGDKELQLNLLAEPEEPQLKLRTFCRVMDWSKQCSFEFRGLKDRKRGKGMKFDYIIGNPPYQDDTLGENETFAPPVYNAFMDAAYAAADKVFLIHPARFLFNAGSTPKAWNQKMLNDKHFKVMYYAQDSHELFTQDIKGGVVISCHDNTKDFGAIEVFTPYADLNTILKKVESTENFESFSNIVVTRTAYKLTDKMHEEHPEAINQLSRGHAYDMSSNIFDRLPQIFFDEKPDSYIYIYILGRQNNARVYKYIRRDYVNSPNNLEKYKIFVPKASGTGEYGEVLSQPVLAEPLVGATESFLSIGAFDTKEEAENALKYIKTKFSRALFGVMKVTQDVTPEKWKYVPLQDFTEKSDIDWTNPIPDIDRQLYKKYGLSPEEVEFIETHVKEMT